jgi:hypothetical protein
MLPTKLSVFADSQTVKELTCMWATVGGSKLPPNTATTFLVVGLILMVDWYVLIYPDADSTIK